MFPLGHIAYTWAGLTALQTVGRARHIDYRLAALAAMLPDLVDKPLSLTILSGSGTSQNLGHTLFAQSMLTIVTAFKQRKWIPYALIVNSHLVADQIWDYPHTLLFPFSGRFDTWRFMGTPSAMLRAYAEIATRPKVLALEVVGLGLLAWVVHKTGLCQTDRARALILTGSVSLVA